VGVGDGMLVGLGVAVAVGTGAAGAWVGAGVGWAAAFEALTAGRALGCEPVGGLIAAWVNGLGDGLGDGAGPPASGVAWLVGCSARPRTAGWWISAANAITMTTRANVAPTSSGAKIDLIESQTAF